MRTSETIAKLSEALATAQGKMEAAKKNATNPFWGKTYATLDSIWEACRAALADNGLSVVQVPMTDESGQLRLITRLCHSSGEWIEGELVLKPAKEDLQGLGSAITYGRRYMLGAIVGVSIDEDDDGNEAATPQPETPRKSQKNSKPPAQKAQPNGKRPVKSAADLLEVVNDKTGYYKNINHLESAIKQHYSDFTGWPAPADTDQWRGLYKICIDHVEANQRVVKELEAS